MLPALHARVGHVHVVVSTYALCIAIGVAAGMVLAVRRASRPDVVLVAGALAVVAGVVASEAWHRIAHGSAGLSSMGGIAGGLATMLLVGRRLGARPFDVLDACAPGGVLGFGIGRLGCFLAGCCYGRPADVAWAVSGADGVARHPVQLYEATADVAIALAVAQTRGGIAAARALIGYGLVRVVVERWRDPASADLVSPALPTVAQLCGAALVLAGLLLSRRRAPHPPLRRRRRLRRSGAPG
jgi:phosphatidylglycerol---prolipoprotein diacylglyceryl transferase